jgi:flagellar motor protein MotB
VVTVNLSSALNGGQTIDSNGNSISFSGLLANTNWSLSPDYDVTFDLLYRSFSFSSNTVLDCIFSLATTFQAVVVWDTVNRQINFQQLSNLEVDKGFKITYKNYMNSLNHQSKADDLVTRFKPYGKDGLTINSVNPTGQSYLDCFDYFLYPFSRDANKNVITSSYYMSDNLAGKILDYNDLVAANQTTYSNLLTQLTNYQTTLTSQQNNLVSLNTTLTQIQNQLDIAQTTGQPTASLLSQQSSQEALITSKQNDINTTNANITSVNNQIASLQQTLSASNNFTQAELVELNTYFVKEKQWSNSSIADPQALMDAAKKEFAKYQTPSVIVSVDVINFYQVVEESRNWDRLGLGYVLYVEYDTIGVNVKSIATEIQFDHSEGNLSVTVSNSEDILRDEEKILKMLYQGSGASASINTNSGTWNQVTGLAGTVNDLYLNGINAAKTEINSAVNNSVVVNNRGITITDSSNANRFLRATNGVIGLTRDGGNSFSTCITPDGIQAPQIVGQLLAGVNLTIGNTGGTFQVTANGVTINNLSLTITGGGLSDSNIASSSKWNTAVLQGTVYNGVVINSTNGLQVTTSTVTSQVTINATNGITIAKNTGTQSSPIWTNQFYVDTSGNVNANNIIANSITVNNSNFNNGQITGSSISVGNGTFTVTSAGALTATSAYIIGTISASTINGSTITGGSITSNTNINVTQDITLGSNLYLTNATNSSKQSIVAPGGSSIDFSGGLMTLSASSQVDVEAYFTYRNSEVATQSWVLSQGYTPSDIRLKKNIMEITHALEKIRSIRGVYFDWNMSLKENNDKENRRQFGVIAQEVERILPELIYSYKSNYKAVDYAKLTALLIEAIKELSDKVDDLSKPYKTN